MYQIIAMIIRVILTIVIVYGVYKETGPFTACSIGLFYLYMESVGYKNRKTRELDKKYEIFNSGLKNIKEKL